MTIRAPIGTVFEQGFDLLVKFYSSIVHFHHFLFNYPRSAVYVQTDITMHSKDPSPISTLH